MSEQEGRIVGFAATGPNRDPDASPGVAEIGAIYLRFEAAGTGVGQALFECAIDDLQERGFEQITLWVLDTNVRARRFYEKNGWMPDGATKIEEGAGATLVQMRYRGTA